MRDVVREVVAYVEKGVVGGTLQSASREFVALELRLFCIKLCSWWRRSTLIESGNSYLSLHEEFPWQIRFREFVAAVPELSELVCCDHESCRFAPAIAREEREAINEFTQANYCPPLMVSYFKQSTPQ
jgi:hypothetical protein